jgi:hypothetical protein
VLDQSPASTAAGARVTQRIARVWRMDFIVAMVEAVAVYDEEQAALLES